MIGYVVSRPVVLRTAMQVKHIDASDDFEKVRVDRVQIAAWKELKYVRKILSGRFPDTPVEALVKVLPYEHLAAWSSFPMLLGRRNKEVASVGNVLREQLLALRARHPQQKRFRILLNNGFGTNLGDTLIGLTAFRAAWSLMKEQLPEVSVDVLLGWAQMGGVTDLLRQHEGVDQILNQGPTLQAMARYHGLLDFSDLIVLPRFGEIPPVDWILWWLGLDPDQVADTDKRNRIALDPAEFEAVAARLRAFNGPRILINAKASTPLRRMPDSVLQSLAQATLAEDPSRWIVFDQPVAFEHPQAIHLADTINSPQRLAALVAQVDGVITPDTFLQHVADATGTPTCTLNASVPAEFFRYYPTVQTLVLPGAESLGGWGKTKVGAQEWSELAPTYGQAWSRLEPSMVLAALARARKIRSALPEGQVSRIDSHRSRFRPELVAPAAGDPSRLVPSGQRPDPGGEALGRQLLKLSERILLPGDTIALLGAGSGDLAVSLADRIAPYGRLVAFEHRRMIFQLLCANVLRSGCEHVEAHPVMPTETDFSIQLMPGLSLRDDHLSSSDSNQLVAEPVVCWPLDRMELPQCRLIVVQGPVPLLPALEGAAATVRRHRPLIVAGPIRAEELDGCQRTLGSNNYSIRTVRLKDVNEVLGDWADDGSLILVAQPRANVVSGE